METLHPLSLLIALALSVCLFACDDDDPVGNGTTADLQVDFAGSVLGEPAALESETFPASSVAEGFRLTRASFYLSDLRLVEDAGGQRLETPLSEVEYILLGPDGEASATFGQVPYGNYSALRFNLGLTAEQDASVPEDYASGTPLSRAEEYWRDWGSYIFLKIEGKSDTLADGNPRYDAAFVYHVGKSAELAREVELPLSLDVDDATERLGIGVDVGKLLDLDGDSPQPLKRVADHNNRTGPTIMAKAQRAFSVDE